MEVRRKWNKIVTNGELTSGALNTYVVYLIQRWDRVLRSKQSLYLPSYKLCVYQRLGIVTLVQVPTCRDVTPCKSVRIQESFGEAYCFSRLHVEYHRPAYIFMKLLLLLPLALQPTVAFGLSNNVLPYLPPSLSIFSLPALEDLFLLPLSIPSWFFPFSSSLPVLEGRSFWASYPPFFPGDLSSLSFALLSILLYFLLCSSLLVLDSSDFFHSPFPYLGPYILLHIFLPKISRANT